MKRRQLLLATALTLSILSFGLNNNSAKAAGIVDGYLDLTNKKIETYDFENYVFDSDLKIAIDAKLNPGSVDTISGNNFTSNNNKILISKIQIINDSNTMSTTALFADGTIKNIVELSTNPVVEIVNSGAKNNYLVTYDNTTGNLKFDVTFSNLKQFINAQKPSPRIYAMSSDEIVKANIGNGRGMGSGVGSAKDVTISGGNNSIIAQGSNIQGITIGSGQVLNLNNIKDINGFSKNKGKGSFINNLSGSFDIDNVTFTDNTSLAGGGVIYNKPNKESYIKNSFFNNNTTSIRETLNGDLYSAGVIDIERGTINIEKTEFNENKAEQGGAFATGIVKDTTGKTIARSTVNVSQNSLFKGNESYNGGAIANFANLNMADSTVTGNRTILPSNELTDAGSGGAIFLGAESITNITNTKFENNYSASKGGAISTRDGSVADNSGAVLDIKNSTFKGNTADGDGGAIFNTFYNSETESGKVSIVNSTFSDNKSGKDGGAIYNSGDIDANNNPGKLAIEDTSFTNNTATGNGGAIFAGDDVSLTAKNKNVEFSGNKAAKGGDIFMDKTGSTLNMNAAEGKSIKIADGISGNNYNMVVNEIAGNTGSVVVNSAIQNATINVHQGMFHLAEGSLLDNSKLTMASGSTLNTIDNKVSTFGNNIILADNTTLKVDLDLSDGSADNFAASIKQGKVIVDEINPLGNPNINETTVINLADALGIDSSNLIISEAIQAQSETILTPIRYIQSSVNSSGILSYGATGNSYNDFNPAVMASSVAAQIGGYLTQLNSYDEAFRNMDMYMLMTKKQRQALKNANKYAAGDSNLVFNNIDTPYTDKAGWFRPYAAFESVGLKNGPKVSNVAYGSYAGIESEMYELGNGWDGIISLYAGYNGSHQSYQGNSIYQNGGTLGLVGMAYKDNFFTGLTVNAGANVGEANTMYGSEDFTMFMTGIASKSGYNYEFNDGKFIIQPNFMMAYSMVNTFDYTNAAGVRINADPLHAITLAPGVKFIGNLNNGWQPYAGVNVIWNIMDKTQFKANDVALPELSVKPYVMYGVGVRKTWGQRFTGFIQAFLTNGGRNGIGLQTGLRWTLGKDPAKYTNSSGEKKYIKAKA